MLLANTLADYAQQEIDLMGANINEMIETLKDTDKTLGAEIKEPSPPDEGDNVLHLDFRPFAEFTALEKVKVPLHELVRIYSRWNDTLWELVHVNKGHYRNKKLVLFLMKFRHVVGTFGNFFEGGPGGSGEEPEGPGAG
jgi:hypothetical protein